MLVDYFCNGCGSTEESLETRGSVPREKECSCGGTQEKCLSAPKIGTVWASAVSRGSSSPPPGFKGTREIYERGTSVKEWRKNRRESDRKQRVSKATKEMGGRLYFS